ncbi:MAG TPA: SAM-dependent DNA methyltransferase [Candidatus Enterosoma merdigallinarum]|nr:SAM-dependent DNA methyltransferase [Candidatus Enterosoma merdigallinarum]
MMAKTLNKDSKPQIKSRERVVEHGEVFTNAREVNAMLDLVKNETERIESRFLEPACGDGNFLAEILHRKLKVVETKYSKSQHDYEKNSFLAVSSIYGVELLEDNAEACRERLFKIWEDNYHSLFPKTEPTIADSIRYLLSKNILCGDALTMKQNNGEPIIFAQWDFVQGDKVKRKDYRLDELLEGNLEESGGQMTLDMASDKPSWEYDPETKMMIPSPIKEYPLIEYSRVQENG